MVAPPVRWRLYREVPEQSGGDAAAHAAALAQGRYVDLALVSRRPVKRPSRPSPLQDKRRRMLDARSETSSSGSLRSSQSKRSNRSLLQEREFNRSHALHVARLRKITGRTLPKAPPPRRPKHVLENPKRQLARRLRYQQLERENKIMRERMTEIWNERTKKKKPRPPSETRRGGQPQRRKLVRPSLQSTSTTPASLRESWTLSRQPSWRTATLPSIARRQRSHGRRWSNEGHIRRAVATYHVPHPLFQAKARAALPPIDDTWQWPPCLAELAAEAVRVKR